MCLLLQAILELHGALASLIHDVLTTAPRALKLAGKAHAILRLAPCWLEASAMPDAVLTERAT